MPSKKKSKSNSRRATVLCAVDFSEDAEAAVVWAAAYAHDAKARLLVLHVVHEPAESPGYYDRHDKGDWARPMKDLAEKQTHKFLRKVAKRNPDAKGLDDAELTLAVGLPVDQILRAARKSGAKLNVMGSRGRSGLPRLLLGSHAQRVVQLAPVPVTIVKRRNS